MLTPLRSIRIYASLSLSIGLFGDYCPDYAIYQPQSCWWHPG